MSNCNCQQNKPIGDEVPVTLQLPKNLLEMGYSPSITGCIINIYVVGMVDALASMEKGSDD